MERIFFVLNNCFLVDGSVNLLTNLETGLQTKLEPRLIEILDILVKNEGKLVSREMLISKIWNNYGGADDGLNQGISILRKALADTNKQIIETVPKKGYILHGTVTNDLNVEEERPQSEKTTKKQPVFLAIFLGGAFILIFLFLFNLGKNKISDRLEKQPDFLLKSGSTASKNWHGKNYKLAFGKDEKIILFENNVQIADSNLINYEIVIQELKDKLTSEQDANR
ncbi:MAG: winged helix-turn-helix domain-containing protein [Chitinophagaceae bacterium]|nr:winged helix-turn-helix domain-containing protein [Chitinophagaceae bacterium]